MRRLGLLLFALLLASTAGCYFTRSPSRPLPALEFRRSTLVREHCLIVFVPGFLDGPDTFLENHFPDEVLASGAPCDSVAVDLHYRYYGETPSSGDGIASIMFADVLEPAAARGYEEIWLVGISMGGLGALLTAERHPELVTGVILLSPFVGEEALLHEIEAAGGAETWHPPAGLDRQPWTQDNYSAHLWSWLRGYATDPDAMPPLYVGWGESDRLGAADRLLAQMQPADHVLTTEGEYNWRTWYPLFHELLARARPGALRKPGAGGNRLAALTARAASARRA